MSGNGVGDGFGNSAGSGAGGGLGSGAGRPAVPAAGRAAGPPAGGPARHGWEKPAGWYYVGDGKLRYRDEHGWTSHYMSTKDPAAQKWPPPPPRTFLQQVLDDQERQAADPRRGSGLRRLFRRRS